MSEYSDVIKEIDALFSVISTNLTPMEQYQLIRPYVDDPRQEVCRSAIVALGNIQHPASVATLRDLLARESHMDCVLCSLGRLGDTSLIPICMRLMESKEPTKQSIAISAIASLSGDQGLPILEKWWEMEAASELRSSLAFELAHKKSLKSVGFLEQELVEHEIAWLSIVLALARNENHIVPGRARILLEQVKVIQRPIVERLFLLYAGILPNLPESLWLDKVQKWIENMTRSKT